MLFILQVSILSEQREIKASNGEKVWLRTGRVTPATFTEAAEILTGSGSTRNREKGRDESTTDI